MNNEKKNDEPTREEILKRKAEIFLEEKKRSHIKLFNGIFYNGFLFEVEDSYLIIHDRKDGKKKVFFVELKLIEEFEGRE
jgi:hypothetical protein